MAQTVSASVKGLKSENVTITDSTGAGPVAVRGGRRRGRRLEQSAEARFARPKEAAINAMLASTLGPGKAKVTINADLNVDETTEKRETYGASKVPLTRTHRERGTRAPRAPPTPAEPPGRRVTSRPTPATAATGATTANRYSNEKATRTNGVNKKVRETKIAPGEFRR